MFAKVHHLPRARLSQLVSSATYGSVLVLASLTVIGISEVAAGHAVELVAGVGGATWVAHLFAELLGDHVHDPEPLGRSQVGRAMADGSPILAATVFPALLLAAGRLDVIGDDTARLLAIAATIIQLASIGAFVGRVTPAHPDPGWGFAVAVAGMGVVVVAITVVLGH